MDFKKTKAPEKMALPSEGAEKPVPGRRRPEAPKRTRPPFDFSRLRLQNADRVFLTVSALNAAYALYLYLMVSFSVDVSIGHNQVVFDTVFQALFLADDIWRFRLLGPAGKSSPAATLLLISVFQALISVVGNFLLDRYINQHCNCIEYNHLFWVLQIAFSTFRLLVRPSARDFVEDLIGLEGPVLEIGHGSHGAAAAAHPSKGAIGQANGGSVTPALGVRVALLRQTVKVIPNATANEVSQLDALIPANDMTSCPADCADGACCRPGTHQTMALEDFHRFVQRGLAVRPQGMSAGTFCRRLHPLLKGQPGEVNLDEPYQSWQVIASSIKHCAGDRLSVTMTVIGSFLLAAIQPAQAYFISMLAEGVTYPDPTREAPPRSLVVKGILGILLLCPLYFAGQFLVAHYAAKMIGSAAERIRVTILDSVLKRRTLRNPTLQVKYPTGSLNNLVSGDLARMTGLWQAMFWALISPAINVFAALIYIGTRNWEQFVIGLLFSIMLLSGGPQKYAAERSRDFAESGAHLLSEFQNSVECRRVIAIFQVRPHIVAKFASFCAAAKNAEYRSLFAASIVSIYISGLVFTYLALQISSIAFLMYHNLSHFRTVSSAADFAGLVSLFQGLFRPMASLGTFMLTAISSAGSLQRLDVAIRDLTEPSYELDGHEMEKDFNASQCKACVSAAVGSREAEKRATLMRTIDRNGIKVVSARLPPMETQLHLRELRFRYSTDEGTPFILDGLSMSFPRGSYNCIVGLSGSGKTTTLSILMGLVPFPESGAIEMDGRNVREFSTSSFLDQIGVVFADIQLLNGTILDNIRLGKLNATEKECREAAIASGCHDWISSLPEGYETVMGQHATSAASTGQAQRICLARALCRKPRLLLLDECTSALDPETERSVVEALLDIRDRLKITILSVTHRYETAKPADGIYVLKDGKLAEQGTYQELASKEGGVLAEILRKQSEQMVKDVEEKMAAVSRMMDGSDMVLSPTTPSVDRKLWG